MAEILGKSHYISFILVLLLLIWKLMLFIANPKRIKFSLPNFVWYDRISVSATYSESGKKIKILSNRITLAITFIVILEILLNFFVLILAD